MDDPLKQHIRRRRRIASLLFFTNIQIAFSFFTRTCYI